tara:strand:- start:307 stop:501 length:195 start_codon:yes stop_codon:yes gene_type:complete
MDVLIVLVAVVLLALMHTVNISVTGVVIRAPRLLVERYLDLIGIHYAEMVIVAVSKQEDLLQIG